MHLFRTVGHISIGPEGTIASIDPEAEALFQVRGGECIGGLVERLLPGLQLPEVTLRAEGFYRDILRKQYIASFGNIRKYHDIF